MSALKESLSNLTNPSPGKGEEDPTNAENEIDSDSSEGYESEEPVVYEAHKCIPIKHSRGIYKHRQ